MVSASFSTYYVKSFQVIDFFKGECLETHEDKKYAKSNLLELEVKDVTCSRGGSAAKHSSGGESKEAVSRLTLI